MTDIKFKNRLIIRKIGWVAKFSHWFNNPFWKNLQPNNECILWKRWFEALNISYSLHFIQDANMFIWRWIAGEVSEQELIRSVCAARIIPNLDEAVNPNKLHAWIITQIQSRNERVECHLRQTDLKVTRVLAGIHQRWTRSASHSVDN